jgi:hypothetical protein
MYNDTECCADGHRNNILNKYRTDVSIGIVYDKYYLAFVQNFENNYGLDIAIEGGSVEVSGVIDEGIVDQIAVRYDAPPTAQVYETNKRMLSYSGGELVAVVVKPLPPGFFYEQPSDYRLMVAGEWEAGGGQPVGVSFNLAGAVSVDGVYTISVIAKGAGDETFEAASHSVLVNSDSDA